MGYIASLVSNTSADPWLQKEVPALNKYYSTGTSPIMQVRHYTHSKTTHRINRQTNYIPQAMHNINTHVYNNYSIDSLHKGINSHDG